MNEGVSRTAFDLLQMQMRAVVSRINDPKAYAAIQAAVPEIIAGAINVVKDKNSTGAQRMEALKMLFTAWTRCAKLESRKEGVSAIKETASARKAEAKAETVKAKKAAEVEEKRHARFVHKVQTKADKVLAAVNGGLNVG